MFLSTGKSDPNSSFILSTKVKGPSQNNTSLCFTLYPLTHEFLSLLWCYLNHFSDVTGTNICWLNVEHFDWLHQFLVIRLAYTKHTRPFHWYEGAGAARIVDYYFMNYIAHFSLRSSHAKYKTHIEYRCTLKFWRLILCVFMTCAVF